MLIDSLGLNATNQAVAILGCRDAFHQLEEFHVRSNESYEENCYELDCSTKLKKLFSYAEFLLVSNPVQCHR